MQSPPQQHRASIYARNRALLLAAAPALEGVLPQAAPIASRLTAAATKSGAITARLGTIWLHSRYDPEREATRLIGQLPPTGAPVCLLYGFGLGYTVEAFQIAFPSVQLIVVDPDPGAFAEALTLRAMDAAIARVRFVIGDALGELADLMPARQQHPIRIVRLRALFELHRGHWSRVDRLLQQTSSRAEINANTLRRFGKTWVRNLLSNLDLVASPNGVHTLSDRLAGLPALVLAAGPSLVKILPSLQELRRRFVVVAVDTALGPCLRAGVEPDLLVVVDPQYWNSRHLDRHRAADTVLISETSTCPRVFRSLRMPNLMASSLFPLGRYFEAMVGTKGEVGAGGSVATTAWDVARIAGCAPIVMAGLDLGFPENRTHCTGTFFEELRIAQGSREQPAMTAAFDYQYSAGPFLAPANSGGQVLTDRRMQVYQSWFESQARRYPTVETLNVSASGLRIQGLVYRPLASLAGADVRPRIDAELDELKRNTVASQPNASAAELLHKLHLELDELAASARAGLAGTEVLATALADHGDPAPAIAALEAIDASISSSAASPIAGFLMQELIDATRGSQPQDGDAAAILAASTALYAGLEESAEFHLAAVRLQERARMQQELRIKLAGREADA